MTTLPDGMGFLVADWNYGGWRKADEAGRLIKLTYTGKSQAAPKPAWFIPAAEGREIRSVRRRPDRRPLPSRAKRAAGRPAPARRARAGGGRAAGRALATTPRPPPARRWSAIWTLDRIDGGKAGREAILAVAKDPKADVSVRRQAIRQLGTRAATEATEALIAALNDPDASIRFRAATALGRIGNAAAVPALSAKLDEPDFFTHYAVFTALKRIGQADPKAWPAIVKGFASDKPEMRDGTALALHDVYDADLVRALSEFVNAANRLAVRPARWRCCPRRTCTASSKPWDGKWWGTQPAGHVAAAEGHRLGRHHQRAERDPRGTEGRRPRRPPGGHPGHADRPRPVGRRRAGGAVQEGPQRRDAPERAGGPGCEQVPAAGPLIAEVLADPANPLAADAIDAARAGRRQARHRRTAAAVPAADADPKLTASAITALGASEGSFRGRPGDYQTPGRQNEVAPAAAAALGQIGGKPAVEALIDRPVGSPARGAQGRRFVARARSKPRRPSRPWSRPPTTRTPGTKPSSP